MKWLKNIENIAGNGSPGKCPNCGSFNTNYKTEEVSDGLGYGVVWCNDCSSACNISRIAVSSETESNIEIPTDLNFE